MRAHRPASAGFLTTMVWVVVLGCGKSQVIQPAAPPDQWFTDVTPQSSLHFSHVAGTNYFMPDQVGSGVAVLDYDNDGRLDLYFVQNGGTNAGVRNQLFHQEADGTFRDASSGSGVDICGRGMGAFAGDVNNDGLVDLLVTEYGAIHLFQNVSGGKFREVTREAGLDNPRWSAPASFIDYDRDGWLDIVVGNYVDYDPTHVCMDVQGQQDFCAPKAFGETATRLWHNLTKQKGEAPHFQDTTEASGIFRARGVALGIICADFDGDGWPDIFCADDGRPNRLFINQKNGTFADEASQRGVAYNAMGATAANMGVAFADVDGDGMGDLFVTHLSEEFHSLFKQGPRGLFADQISAAGLQQQSWRGTGFGTVLIDFNCDESPDLASANGLVRRIKSGQTPVLPGLDPWWGRYAQKPQLWRNDGTGKFQDVSVEQPAWSGRAVVGRSLAVADLNRDGMPDLILCTIGGPARLFRNTISHHGHWIRLRLLLPAQGDRDAIGAEVIVVVSGKPHWAVLQPAASYLSSSEAVVHFGLGAATKYDSIEVLWPDGNRERFPGASADQVVICRKGQGK